jgi:FSR family fosmidomycin resistance protein-like MFS transporter
LIKSGTRTFEPKTPAIATLPEPAADEFDQRGTLTVSGAHFAHDLYSSFLGPLIPAVQEKLGVSLFIASLMVPAQQMPSIIQPFIGAWSDRTSKRWFVVLAPGVAALTVSTVGLAPHVGLILMLLVCSGLASAAFHAPSIALVGEYGGKKTGRAMSYFMFGGEASRSIGPLIITAAIAWFTLEGSFVVAVFGVAASVILYFTVDTTRSDTEAAARLRLNIAIRPLLRARIRWLTGLFGFNLMISAFNAPFAFFLFKYLLVEGRSDWFAGLSLSLYFAAGGFGGLIWGPLSDHIGRRRVLYGTLGISPLIVYAYLFLEHVSGLGMVVLILAGVFSMASRPIMLAMAQEILPESRAQMSGLMLAFGFVTMSLITMAFGAISDRVGVDTALWYVPLFGFLSLPFIALMPRRGEQPAQAKPA